MSRWAKAPARHPAPTARPTPVNFRAATPISWQYLHLRVLTLGGLTAPPSVVNGALTQGASDRRDGHLLRTPVATAGSAHGRASRVSPAGDQYDQHSAVGMIIADGPLPDICPRLSGPTWECTSWRRTTRGGRRMAVQGHQSAAPNFLNFHATTVPIP